MNDRSVGILFSIPASSESFGYLCRSNASPRILYANYEPIVFRNSHNED